MARTKGLAILAAGIGIVFAATSAIAQSGTGSGNRPATPPGSGASPPSSSTTTPKPAPKPSMRELLKKGYEIVAVTVSGPGLPDRDRQRPQESADSRSSLQKGRKIAACQYSSINWIALAKVSVEGTTQCDVYPK